MKKVISLLLAILMAFSLVTVAFATEGEAAASETTDVAPEGSEGGEGESEEAPIDLGEYQWSLDLPVWTVGPALKFAKIALKLVSAYLKVAKIFGLVDQDMGDMIMGAIMDMIENSQNAENGDAEVEESTAPAADAA